MIERATWALVSGASRGIGAAIAMRLAKDGYPVIVNYRERAEQAAKIVEAIETAGGRAVACRFDVRDALDLERELRPQGRIAVLVHNAGIVADAPFPAMRAEQWKDVLSTSLDGFYNLSQWALPHMLEQRWGRIIVISSVSAVLGNRGQVNYAAAKSGLIGAVKSLAREVAKRKITVNAVAPGLIDTEMLGALPREELTRLVPMQRLGRAEEVAELVGFLASESAAYITGQVIGINGGMA